MTEEQLFLEASRKAYRFPGPKGELTTEDLWKLKPSTTSKSNPLSLSFVGQAINRKLRDTVDDDFVNDVPTEDKVLRNKLEIVKYIIAVKKQEASAKSASSRLKAEQAELMQDLQNTKFAGMSREDKQAELAKINKQLAES